MTTFDFTDWLTTRASDCGFAAVGITRVEQMDPAPLRAWLAAGYAAEMAYLQRHLPLRAHLDAVMPGARSVICVALAYPGPTPDESPIGAVARYARGADYHTVVRERLQQLWTAIARREGGEGRIFVDGGPLPERELARRAGLGWVGRHGCLLHPRLGSRFVLGEILTTLDLPTAAPLSGSCGDCRACLQACPTRALVAPGIVDARRCLSYLTIEHRGAIPCELRPLLGTRLFGCDSCQDACPYNRGVGKGIASPLGGRTDLHSMDLTTVPALSAEAFRALFAQTPLLRAKRRGLLRNACVALGNRQDPSAIPALRDALHDEEALIRGHAAWALGQLGADELLKDALRAEEDTICV